MAPHSYAWALRPAVPADLDALAELRATVMRADLQRLGRYDDHRVRQRLRDTFSPRYTSVVTVNGELAGCVTVRPVDEGQWLEHFYLDPARQRRGLGSAVLRSVLAETDARGLTVGLHVLRGSAAIRLYERHGFVVVTQGPVDVHMSRRPGGTAADDQGSRTGMEPGACR
ncbi:MAG TPA: GNAT family N-acetyltransferase [Actinocatenispora sp.]